MGCAASTFPTNREASTPALRAIRNKAVASAISSSKASRDFFRVSTSTSAPLALLITCMHLSMLDTMALTSRADVIMVSYWFADTNLIEPKKPEKALNAYVGLGLGIHSPLQTR